MYLWLLTILFGSIISFAFYYLYMKPKFNIPQKKPKNKPKSNKKQKNTQQKKSGKKRVSKNSIKALQQKLKQGGSHLSSRSSKKNSSHPALLKPPIDISNTDLHPHLISVFRGHLQQITKIAWHDTNNYLLSVAKDHQLHIWEDPCELGRMTIESIGSLSCNDSGGYFSCLATVNRNKKSKQYFANLKIERDKYKDDDKKINHKFDNTDEVVNHAYVTTSKSKRLLVLLLKRTSKTGVIRIQCLQEIWTAFEDPINFIGIHPQQLYACVGILRGNDTRIFFYDILAQHSIINNNNSSSAKKRKKKVNDDKSLANINVSQFTNNGICISPNGNFISVATFKHDIPIFDTVWNKPKKHSEIRHDILQNVKRFSFISKAHGSAIDCVLFSCNNQYLITGCNTNGGVIRVWDLKFVDPDMNEFAQLLFEYKLRVDEIGDGKTFVGISGMCMSKSSDLLGVLDGKKQMICIFRVKYHQKRMKFLGVIYNCFLNLNKKNGKITCMEFSPDCRYIALGTTESDVRVYKIPGR